jgi:hypothetical protein
MKFCTEDGVSNTTSFACCLRGYIGNNKMKLSTGISPSVTHKENGNIKPLYMYLEINEDT